MEPENPPTTRPSGLDHARLASDLEHAAGDALVILRATIRRLSERAREGKLTAKDAVSLAKMIDNTESLSRRLRWRDEAMRIAKA